MPHKIAPFVKKTFELVSDTSTDSIVCWSKDGTYFCILQPFKFQSDILPIYFNHRNTSSFIRQLNIYNFHKIPSTNDTMEFQHPQFVKDGLHQLQYITRKTQCGKRSRKQSKQTNVPVNFSVNDINELTNSKSYKKLDDVLSNKNEIIKILSSVVNKHKEDKQKINKLSKEIEELKSQKPDKKRSKHCQMEPLPIPTSNQLPLELSFFNDEIFNTSNNTESILPDYSDNFDLPKFLEV